MSNHAGRQIDGAIGSADALPPIVARVAGRIPVLLDSGIRSGADVFTALALGADAVLVGRPYAYGLAIAGADGAEAVLRNIIAEFDLVLGLSGHRSVAEITADAVTEGSMTDHVVSIDQGTTSTRAIVFDHAGLPVGSGQLEHRQIFPKAGWVEHDAVEIWKNTREVIGLALGNANLTRHDVVAVGITNQRETAVVWDKATGKPVHNAIVWQDTRTQEHHRPHRRRRPRPLQAAHRPAARDLLLGEQDRVDPRQRRWRPRPRRGGRTAVRHHRHVAALEPDR